MWRSETVINKINWMPFKDHFRPACSSFISLKKSHWREVDVSSKSVYLSLITTESRMVKLIISALRHYIFSGLKNKKKEIEEK